MHFPVYFVDLNQIIKGCLLHRIKF